MRIDCIQNGGKAYNGLRGLKTLDDSFIVVCVLLPLHCIVFVLVRWWIRWI